ncbi:hypothetical protein HK405_002404 [Cladochytrium tenue]|nr:hypothetical protein HK405_002404 [Cladochytrium tenue]
MADRAGGGGPDGAAAPQQQQGSGGISGIVQMVLRGLMIYYAVQFVTGQLSKSSTPASQPAPAGTPAGFSPGAGGAGGDAGGRVGAPVHYQALWSAFNMPTDLYVYVSEEETFDSFSDKSKLVWKEKGIVYGNLNDARSKDIELTVPAMVQNNGSWYAHIYLTQQGRSPDPESNSYAEDATLYLRKLLSRFQKKKKEVIKKKLIDAKASKESLISDAEEEIHPDGIHYYPIFYADDFWLLSDQLHPINATVQSLNLSMHFAPKSWWYYQMLIMMDDNFRSQSAMMGGDGREHEEMKRMFLEANPVLLAITMVVSTFHSVFDFLAFKNDIQFWKDKKDMDGMSFRSIIMNVGFQLIIFLYLLDNETSWMIVISNGIGLAIEAWKIQKTVIVKTKPTFPFVEFIDKYKPSKLAKKTQKYDQLAFKYLSYVLYPCLAGYTIYSLVYEEHKSWYSFVVGTLVGFVYTFGFISMTPQLFINYKLKSVAHMPWKTFMYKALNTVIDDLFAFVIKMPWLHRLACFRDDIVFVIYLYQRWIYPEDKRRRNEFGQVGEEGAGDDDDFADSDDDAEPPAKKDAADETKKTVGDGKSKGSKAATAETPAGTGNGLRKRATAGAGDKK